MQDNYHLTAQEIAELVRKYQSEVRKLEYQILKTQETIDDLQGRLGSSKIESVAPTITVIEPEAQKKRRGRPRKNMAEETTVSSPMPDQAVASASPKRSIPKKKTGYRLSDWDKFIIENLEHAQHVLINSQLMDMAKQRVDDENMGLSDVQLRGKLNRSIHKLSNKRGELVKVDYPGKGFAYGLSEWADAKGEVKQKYRKDI
ncbi:MAG: hypothetical protein KDC44_02555 [Phaeodactylibacter sp.]|nr:hypothetical protein [Phaeodactylibacter sp.]